MIQLQRASAGSGKTYTLARKFIGYLITTPVDPNTPNGKRRLCANRSELLRSLSGILAITFTNKATAEMKERIVDKLSVLADPDTPADDSKVDYLEDFKRETGRTRAEIAAVCRMAIDVVLNNFSDFNVSTIDSFFQSVLRTFAYETNLSDGYQVEMDSDLLATMAINMSMDDINMSGPGGNGSGEPPVKYWIERLMRFERDNGGKGWNIYARSGSDAALYQECIRTAKKMENEEYKLHKSELDNYFNQLRAAGLTFRNVYELLERENERPLLEAYGEMKKAAGELEEILSSGVAENVPLKANLAKHASAILHSRPLGNEKETLFSYAAAAKDMEQGSLAVTATNLKKKAIAAMIDTIRPIEEKAAAMYGAWMRWCGITGSIRFRYWMLYRKTLLLLGMLHEVRRNVRDYLNDNGMVELSDTGIILRDIIGDSDVPFIYERLGTRLSHYLIDEFQDTSTLQWDNIRPLLKESNSHGEESLVIGDAKQSIYRFRNANSEIITSLLPKQFAEDCLPCGDSVEENTNWRSDRIIVEFNNYLFHTLASRIKLPLDGVEGAEEVYSGIVQRPSHKSVEGLVSVKYFEKKKSEDKSEADDRDAPPPYFKDFGPLVKEFLARGYRQRDVAFLVNRKAEGKQIIDSFVAYNSTLAPGETKIEFVSEESLLVASSTAVATVIAALKALSAPRTVKTPGPDAKPSHGFTTWEEMEGHYNLFVMRNGGKSTPELLDRFKKIIGSGEDPVRDLYETVAAMQAHTLPALVEQFIHELVSPEAMKEETPYIAAFQDLVLEYCERNQADVASFLKWWDTTGCRSTISSPEDIDAVKVMTIHKSKGLQFKCVVVPEVNFAFTPSSRKSEWLWVEPDDSIALTDNGESIPLPPVVPVDTGALGSLLNDSDTSAGDDEFHREAYTRFLKAFLLDIINKAYVAFTRAEEELHIYASYSPTEASKVRETLSLLSAREEGDADSVSPGSGEESGAGDKKIWQPIPCSKMSDALVGLLVGEEEWMEDVDPDRRLYMLQPDVEKRVCISKETDTKTNAPAPFIGSIEFGRAKSFEENEAKRRAKARKEGDESRHYEFATAHGYRAMSFPSSLRYREPDTGMITGDEEEQQRIDARSKGNLLHSVLERMETLSDLDKAIRSQRVKGRFTAEGERDIRATLTRALEHPEVRGWFRPGLRVMQERSLLIGTKESFPVTLRPDRIIVDEEGRAIVIDYKFGEPRRVHRRQVSAYASTLSRLKDAGGKPLFTSVEGRIWYVLLGKVESC